MHQHNQPKRVHPEHIVLDIGGDIGALIIYTQSNLVNTEIEVSPKGDSRARTHTEVLERRVKGEPKFAAVYAALPQGEYQIWAPDPRFCNSVAIAGGEVAELDWSASN